MDSVLDWIPVLVSALAFILGLLNLWFRGPSMNMVEKGQYLKSTSEAITIANERALKAEKRVQDLENKLTELEGKISDFENSMFYKISFFATLGTKPQVEHVEIEHYKERRVRDYPVKIERRKL